MYRRFENLVDPFATSPDTVPPKNLRDYWKAQIKPFRRWIGLAAITGFVVATVEMCLIFYAGRLIDIMEASGPAAFWATHWPEICAVAFFIIVLRPLFQVCDQLLLNQTIGSNIQEQARWHGHKHLIGQSIGFFQNDFAGRLSNRVMQLGPAVEDSINLAFDGIWFSLTYVTGALIILSQMNGWLTLPLLLWVIVYVLYTRFIAKRVAVASEKWSDARSMATGRVVDSYTNIETVKLFGHRDLEEGYARSALQRLRLRFQRFLRLMTEMNLGLNTLNGFLIVGLSGLAVWFWTVDRVSIGEVAAATGLAIRLNGMSGWIMWVAIRLFENAGTIRESLRSIAVAHDVVDGPNAPELVVDDVTIRVTGLSHHYGKGTGGLENVSLDIPAGQRVGLVGRSGAGKSSLVNLLLRFRDAEHGTIEIDGQDIANVRQESLRRQIGMVTQDSSLLHRSVRANILYGRPEASEAQMIDAAKRARAHDFIQDLADPNGNTGYNAQVGERGVKLSGGQRQRIAIARVILKDAPILVLDEATSALDSEVEAQIQSTLYDVMEGKTVIAIAHRLSTIARMDRIVVLDQGRIVEEGSHDALLAQGGLYAGLWARQSGGFLGTDLAV